MIVVDRASFIAWTEGVLLDRKADGSFVCGDNEINERAERALEEGQTIGLSVGGELMSTMALNEEQGGYVEVSVKDDSGKV